MGIVMPPPPQSTPQADALCIKAGFIKKSPSNTRINFFILPSFPVTRNELARSLILQAFFRAMLHKKALGLPGYHIGKFRTLRLIFISKRLRVVLFDFIGHPTVV
jgi:hypothetical protein